MPTVTKRSAGVLGTAALAAAVTLGVTQPAPSNAEFAALQRQVTALQSRVAKLEAAVFPSPTPSPRPTPIPTLITVGPPPTPTITLAPATLPPAVKVAQFPGSGPATAAAFLALARDESIDEIDWAGGTYAKWAAFLDVARVRPLLVRPVGDVVWDGTGTINTPPWRIGWSSRAANITFDPSGTGTFTIANYRIGKAGLVMVRYGESIAMNGVHVRGSEGGFGDGIPGQQQHAHAVYITTDETHRSKNLTFNDWDVEGPANRMLNGLQTYGATTVDGLTALRWKVRNLHRWLYLWSNPTGVVIDGWVGSDSDATVDNTPNQAKGVVSNCRATSSGALTPGAGFWKAGQLVGSGNVAS